MKWNVRYLEEAYCDLKNLDNSIQKLVVKAIRKVSQNPFPNNEGGYGKPLSNQKDSKLAGLLKIKLLKAGIRIVYRLEIKDGVMEIVVISVRDDKKVYKMAHQRINSWKTGYLYKF